MRFVAVLLFFYLLTALPCLDLYINWYRRGIHLIARKALWIIPLVLIVPLAVLQHATDLNRVAEWYLWALLTAIFTANIYVLFDLIARYTGKRTAIIMRCFGGALAMAVASVFVVGAAQRHTIDVRTVDVEIDNLPSAFEGKRIAHITDLHLGNLTPQRPYLEKIVQTINAETPDMICFTGDIVHLNANDSSPSDTILRLLRAPLGKYAVMGNHDYGDYTHWPTDAAKQHNLERTKQLYKSLGFTLLCDSAIYIGIDTDTIGLIGVENWGKPPFPQYGDMARATAAYRPQRANILLSHDPNHWEGEIVPRYPWVDLTLAGHTHAAQCGIETEGWTFSPSQWIFRHWDGLYTTRTSYTDRPDKTQHLFVSRGLGYVGIPFRFGMLPEVTIITLTKR